MIKLIEKLGDKISLLYFVLVILIFCDVLLRYTFSLTKVWIGELEWHIFAFLFLMGMGHTLLADKHVRVDLFYAKFSKANKIKTDIIGNLIFLVPWCIVIIATSYNYVLSSWAVRETSANPNGLAAKYLIKSMIIVGFVILLLAGLAQTKQLISKLNKQ